MASIMRPGLVKQAFQAPAASQRMLSSIARSSMTKSSPLAQQFRPAFVRSTIPASSRIAAFHATQRQQLLPAEAQRVEGTVNDPTPVPTSSPSHGSYHWSFERLVSAGLIPLSVAPFAAGSLNPVTDAILGSLLIIHCHIGFEACIIDYFPKRRVPGIHKAAMWALRAGTVALGLALYSFETNDVGLTEAAKRLWVA